MTAFGREHRSRFICFHRRYPYKRAPEADLIKLARVASFSAASARIVDQKHTKLARRIDIEN